MNHAFHGKLNDLIPIYLYDILFVHYSIEDDEAHLHWAFNQLWKTFLRARKENCCFGLHRLKYLGYIITPSGITVEPEKIKAIGKF